LRGLRRTAPGRDRGPRHRARARPRARAVRSERSSGDCLPADGTRPAKLSPGGARHARPLATSRPGTIHLPRGGILRGRGGANKSDARRRWTALSPSGHEASTL